MVLTVLLTVFCLGINIKDVQAAWEDSYIASKVTSISDYVGATGSQDRVKYIHYYKRDLYVLGDIKIQSRNFGRLSDNYMQPDINSIRGEYIFPRQSPSKMSPFSHIVMGVSVGPKCTVSGSASGWFNWNICGSYIEFTPAPGNENYIEAIARDHMELDAYDEAVKIGNRLRVNLKDFNGDGYYDLLLKKELPSYTPGDGSDAEGWFDTKSMLVIIDKSLIETAEQGNTQAGIARVSAEQAKQAADKALNQINNPAYGLEALRDEILNIKTTINKGKPAPVINFFKCLNNATATTTSSIILDTSVSNVTHYRVNNGSWQLYTQGQLAVNNLIKGVNRIEIEFGNFEEKEGRLEGNTSKGVATVFGL